MLDALSMIFQVFFVDFIEKINCTFGVSLLSSSKREGDSDLFFSLKKVLCLFNFSLKIISTNIECDFDILNSFISILLYNEF